MKAVRSELKILNDDEEIQRNPLLILKGLEMELSVVISRATEGGIKFYLVTADAKYAKQ